MGVVTSPGGSSIGPSTAGACRDLNAGKTFLPPTVKRVIWWRDSPTLFPLLYVYSVSDILGRGCQWWLPGNREKPLSGASL